MSPETATWELKCGECDRWDLTEQAQDMSIVAGAPLRQCLIDGQCYRSESLCMHQPARAVA